MVRARYAPVVDRIGPNTEYPRIPAWSAEFGSANDQGKTQGRRTKQFLSNARFFNVLSAAEPAESQAFLTNIE